MDSLRQAPDPALEAIVGSSAEHWTITRPIFINVLMAHLDVGLAEDAVRYSFSVSAWTEDELQHRIERVRRSAAVLLDRRRWERENLRPEMDPA